MDVTIAVALAMPVAVATAATVLSSSGVVEYVIISPPNASEAVARGRVDTADALGKATRSTAGAEGSREARLNSPGARTLDHAR